MFLICRDSEDTFAHHFTSLMIESEKEYFCENDSLYFEKIFITTKNKEVIINFLDYTENLKLPVSFSNLKEKIFLKLTNYKIGFDGIFYYPINQKIKNNDLFCKLTHTHSLILNHLFLYKQGINKELLYKKIWPMDKQISINKIDTHMTNLKNVIKKNINFSIQFTSKNGLLKLIAN